MIFKKSEKFFRFPILLGDWYGDRIGFVLYIGTTKNRKKYNSPEKATKLYYLYYTIKT